jgi:hypothetical protein
MISLGLWLLVLGVSTAQAASINQQTDGPCSPVVGQTGGNVTIILNCQTAVDPKVLKQLNESFNKANKNERELQEVNRKVENWANRFNELFRQAKINSDYQLGRQAEALLRKGKLDQADTLLNPPPITMAHYHAIQLGMSYQEVVRILGRPGEELTRSPSIVSYVWKNTDHSNLVAVFINDQLHTKGPSGLR